MDIKDLKVGMKIRLEDSKIPMWLDRNSRNATFYKKNGFVYVLVVGSLVTFYGDNMNNTDNAKLSLIHAYIEPQQNKNKKEDKVMSTEKKLTQKKVAIQARRERGKKIKELREQLGIEKILINGTALIVFFKDGAKVVEKAVAGDNFDLEIGIALAYVHKLSGGKGLFKEAVDKISKQTEVYVKEKK